MPFVLIAAVALMASITKRHTPDSTSKKVEASLPGTKESLTITVLEAPPARPMKPW